MAGGSRYEEARGGGGHGARENCFDGAVILNEIESANVFNDLHRGRNPVP